MFVRFLKEVWRDWWTLMGGAIGVILGFVASALALSGFPEWAWAFFVAGTVSLVICSYRVWHAVQTKLDAILAERGRAGILPLRKINANYGLPAAEIIGAPRIRILQIVLVLGNSSTVLVRFTIKKIVITIHNQEYPSGPYGSLVINGGENRDFNCKDISADFLNETVPLELGLSYIIEYDTDPPIRPRISEKSMIVRIPPVGGGGISFSIHTENES